MTTKSRLSYWDAYLAEEAEVAERQRAIARAIAQKLLDGTPLHHAEAMVAAAILRGWADALKDAPQRKRGQPPLFNHSDAQMLYLAYVSEGHMKKSVALAKIAEQYGVTVEAMKDCIKKAPGGMKAFFGKQ